MTLVWKYKATADPLTKTFSFSLINYINYAITYVCNVYYFHNIKKLNIWKYLVMFLKKKTCIISTLYGYYYYTNNKREIMVTAAKHDTPVSWNYIRFINLFNLDI